MAQDAIRHATSATRLTERASERADVTLLPLDEFQALAAARDDFVAACRTALQKHPGHAPGRQWL